MAQQPITEKRISSPDNPLVREAGRLKLRKYRDRSGRFRIEGIHLAQEALATGAKLATAFIRETAGESLPAELSRLREQLDQAGVPVVLLPGALFDDLAETESPQGILCIASRETVEEGAFFTGVRRPGSSHFLLLDRIQDPGNAGTMLRAADAFNARGAIALKGTVDLFGDKAIRASAGSIFRMPILYAEDGSAALDLLRAHNVRLLVARPDAGSLPAKGFDGAQTAIAIGNEGGGIDPVLTAGADAAVQIPMRPGVESLNAAVAAAILLYEGMRQPGAE